jgi:hypothetical protein
MPKSELSANIAMNKIPVNKTGESSIDYQDPKGVARPSTSSASSVNP